MTPLTLTTPSGERIAYQHQFGQLPGVIFCCGFRSDMGSTKATALAEWCAAHDTSFIRFDYFAHGASDGAFEDFTIGRAIADTLEILDHVAPGPQILIGSSMGAWVALRVAQERKSQIKGLIGIAPAPDFTERLMFAAMTPEQRNTLQTDGNIWAPSDYGDDYPITERLITEARDHLLLDDVIGLPMPIQLYHGQEDTDVPWETSLLLAKQLVNDDVTVTLIKDGTHRLSRPSDLALMTEGLARMMGR